MDSTTQAEGREPLLIQARSVTEQILADPSHASLGSSVLDELTTRREWDMVAQLSAALVRAHRERFNHAAALEAADRGIAAAVEAASGPAQARCLTERAMVELELGQPGLAEADLAAARLVGGADPEVSHSAATIAWHRGDLLLARDLWQEVVNNPASDNAQRARALNNLAAVELVADPQAALELLDRARPLATSAVVAGFIEQTTGTALAHANRIAEAMEAFERAGGILDGLTGLLGEHDGEVARVLADLRLLPEARAAADRALAALSGEGGALIRADILLLAGQLAARDSDPEAAEELLNEAMTSFTVQGRLAGQAMTAIERAVVCSSVGECENCRPGRVFVEAENLHELGHLLGAARGWTVAAGLSSDTQFKRTCWLRICALGSGVAAHYAEQARARLALLNGDLDSAAKAVADGLLVVDGRAAVAGSAELRHRIAASRSRFELLLRQVHANDDAATQLETILTRRPPAAGSMAGPIHDDDRLMWRQLAARVTSGEEAPEAESALRAAFVTLEHRLRRSDWAATGAEGHQPRGLAHQLRRDGRPTQVVVTVARVGNTAKAYVARSARDVECVSLGPWEETVSRLDRIRRGLTRLASQPAGSPAGETLRALIAAQAGQLDAPLAPLIPDHARVLLMLDRGLDSGPWLALPSLWVRPVSTASLTVTASEPARTGDLVVIAVGPGLSWAATEAERVAALYPSVVTVRDAAELREAAPHARVVHIAAHASLRFDNPLQSPIRLHDGPFALVELLEVGARPELLYLSCCSLGSQGSDRALAGAIPMLTENGIGTVVASTIPLPDADAPLIAEATHAAFVSGDTASAGLARARVHTPLSDPATNQRFAALAGLAAFTAVR